MASLLDWLYKLSDNKLVVVDAEIPSHLTILGEALRALQGQKRFLYRSAASFINGLGNCPVKEYQPKTLSALRLKTKLGNYKPGLVMVGSYVPLADEQVDSLLKEDSCLGIEFPVKEIASAFENRFNEKTLFDIETLCLERIYYCLSLDKTPVLYSSRGELAHRSLKRKTEFGYTIAESMARIVSKVSDKLGYVISKGGVTTNVFLARGLNIDMVRLKGQLLPGLSVVCADSYILAKRLPIVTFPGNLGQKETLYLAWKLMEGIS